MAAGSRYSPKSGRLRRRRRPWRLALMGSSPKGWRPGGVEEHAGALHAPAGRGRGGIAGSEDYRGRFLPTMPNDMMNVNASSVL